MDHQKIIRCTFGLTICFGIAITPGAIVANSADVEGSSDHHLVLRYAGSDIVAYKRTEFDEYNLIVKRVLSSGGMDNNLESTIRIEGKVTRITYAAPPGDSTLEVAESYQQTLEAGGFEVLFSCVNEDCGGRFFNHARSTPYHLHFAENYGNQRYLAARLDDENGVVALSLYTVHRGAVGSYPDQALTQLDIVETDEMQQSLVRVDVDAMEEALERDGHIALYNIYFDIDSDELKSESVAGITEIASLLEAQPDINLLVVVHTDGQGDVDQMQDLSSRQAISVVNALVAAGIGEGRLTPLGVGMAAPVAGNHTSDGRGKNRRVELVVR